MATDLSHLRVALVHDYLREYGGAERVLETLHEMFPEAPLYTAFVDPEALGRHWQRFRGWKIIESSAARIPFIHKNIVFSPLRILASYFFEGFDLSDYDVVISSTNMYMAKAVLTGPSTLHLSYIHTPPRSLYGYITRSDWKGNPITHFLGNIINFRMRAIDYLTAQRPDILIANSKEVARRIQKFYKRESIVIYPPVTVPTQDTTESNEQPYLLYVGRITRSKHVDFAIQAAMKLGKKLKVVGAGKGEEYLHSLADDHIEFLSSINDTELAKLYAGAESLLFPAEDEDFGIVPVEAMMAGVPVIAHNSGGPRETVIDGKTGVLFDELTIESVTQAIEKASTITFDHEKIKKHALMFSKDQFKEKILNLIGKEYQSRIKKGEYVAYAKKDL